MESGFGGGRLEGGRLVGWLVGGSDRGDSAKVIVRQLLSTINDYDDDALVAQSFPKTFG